MNASNRSPSRWAWMLPVLAVALVLACSTDLSVNLSESNWGFTTIDAASAVSGGTYSTTPQAVFFRGRITQVPNANLVIDSCSDGVFTGGGNDFTGVTFLEPGEPVTIKLGARTDTLLRVDAANNTTYEKAGVTYTPGDSAIISVPGAVGGFPASNIHAKTAETFTFSNITRATGTEAIQLRWSPSSDANSAMILELRYSPTGGSTPTRELLCSYTDDGIDSIPFRQYDPWNRSSASARQVVATRLRTNFVAVSDGLMEVISTFHVPVTINP